MTTVAVNRPWPGVINAYPGRVAIPPGARVITLREGGTPLIAAEHLSELTGCQVFLKVEGVNPTGSFKDRGLTVAITHALAAGARAVICASTGNTSASAAAYAARAGLPCAVLVPAGRVAAGKLAQAIAHGASPLRVDGNFDDCLELARTAAAEYPIELVNSVNPVRLEGQKSAAFEICDALGRAPDAHFLPVGNAGNITAYWRGYREYLADGLINALPRMFGVQARGAAPLVAGAPIANPETVATAIRIGNPASWSGAIEARDASGGRITSVSDESILAAQRLLAEREGAFVEPASAAGVAGLLAEEPDQLPRGGIVVCTVTGHGLKDSESVINERRDDPVIPADPIAVADVLGLR